MKRPTKHEVASALRGIEAVDTYAGVWKQIADDQRDVVKYLESELRTERHRMYVIKIVAVVVGVPIAVLAVIGAVLIAGLI